jgi:putative oxygen-independent coproporphyrinogen III oxidase
MASLLDLRGSASPLPASPTATAPSASVYVHFPWCLAKCPYCDFVSYVPPDVTPERRPSIDHGGYADAILRELDARAPRFKGRPIDSVFFGGGTPSLWDAAELGRVLGAIRERLRVGPTLEVTVECNPTSLGESNARALAAVGVNRLSIGVQSLDAERLRFLGRLHDPDGARGALAAALRSGPRVSGDLIFGLPGQSPDDARAEATALVDLGLSHVSCYQLTIESGTRFGELARRGRLPLAEDGVVAESFLAIDEALGARGLRHYEISNYARPGEEARHNLAYWRGDEYLGLGCGAVGFVRADTGLPAHGVRWRNAVRPEEYVDATRDIARDTFFETPSRISPAIEALGAVDLLRERIMLGLRLESGFDLDAAARSLGIDAWTPERQRAVHWLEERGRLVRDGARLAIPRAAWLWADDTCARLF